jgi:hypothetical protein
LAVEVCACAKLTAGSNGAIANPDIMRRLLTYAQSLFVMDSSLSVMARLSMLWNSSTTAVSLQGPLQASRPELAAFLQISRCGLAIDGGLTACSSAAEAPT